MTRLPLANARREAGAKEWPRIAQLALRAPYVDAPGRRGWSRVRSGAWTWFVRRDAERAPLERAWRSSRSAAAVLIAYDPAAGELELAYRVAGALRLSWIDSLSPCGPSEALIVDEHGAASIEDPRCWAHAALGRPEGSGWLDRFAFIEDALKRRGVTGFDPCAP